MRWLAACLVLAGCGAPTNFAGSGSFDPLAFFTGHVTSWGVEEDRAGTPTAIVTTDCTGIITAPGHLRMTQILHIGAGAPQTRLWDMARTGPTTFDATANDMAGVAHGTVSGRTLHWRWTLETHPGNPLANVVMDQNFYRMDDGAVVIRTIVTKLSIRLVEITEQFRNVGGAR
jgi:hypothetical protein